MHEELWAGVELKVQNAEFHLQRMEQSLNLPEPTALYVALEASGAILGTDWHRSFYAHLDAFLSAVRSVPEVIQFCFGKDDHHLVRQAFAVLPPEELARRCEFKKQFKSTHNAFRHVALSEARHISEHRTGFAPVNVTVVGMLGITYVGGPTKQIPTTETRHIDDAELAWMQNQIPIRPIWDRFYIDEKPLFPECRNYLACARDLVNEAHTISDRVHGNNHLTLPRET
jgi:hypothetical protein